MKIRIYQSDIDNLLSTKSDHLFIQYGQNNTGLIITTDEKDSICSTLVVKDLEWSPNDKYCIEVATEPFYNVLKAFKGLNSNYFELYPEDNWLGITVEPGNRIRHWKIYSKPLEYAAPTEPPGLASFKIKADDLFDCYNKVKFINDTEYKVNPYHSKLCLTMGSEHIKLTATDGYKMAINTCECIGKQNFTENNETKALFSPVFFKTCEKVWLQNPTPTLTFFLHDNYSTCVLGDMTIRTKLFEAKDFPPTEKVLDACPVLKSDERFSFSFINKELIRGLAGVTFIKNKSNKVAIKVSKKQAVIIKSNELASGEIKIDVVQSQGLGSYFIFAINHNFLVDFLKMFPENYIVTIQAIASNEAILIKAGSITYLMMPVPVLDPVIKKIPITRCEKILCSQAIESKNVKAWLHDFCLGEKARRRVKSLKNGEAVYIREPSKNILKRLGKKDWCIPINSVVLSTAGVKGVEGKVLKHGQTYTEIQTGFGTQIKVTNLAFAGSDLSKFWKPQQDNDGKEIFFFHEGEMRSFYNKCKYEFRKAQKKAG